MTFKQIEYALELSRTLNFRKAAENLYISQPALSYQIRNLEQELGVELFTRSGHGIALTLAGADFCRKMRGIYDQSQDVLLNLKGCGSQYEDLLRVGAFHSHTMTVLPEIMERFIRQQPKVLLDVQLIQGARRVDALFQDELDLIFFNKEHLSPNAHFTYLPLFESRIYCVLRRDHPLAGRARLTAEDLAQCTLFFCSGQGPAELLRAQNRLRDTVPVQAKPCRDADTALLWVSAGPGIALVPGFCHTPNSNLCWVPYDWPRPIESGLAFRNENSRPSLEDFCRTAREVYQEIAEANGIL